MGSEVSGRSGADCSAKTSFCEASGGYVSVLGHAKSPTIYRADGLPSAVFAGHVSLLCVSDSNFEANEHDIC